jgi:hypothetical protein
MITGGPPPESTATLRCRGVLFSLHRALAFIRQVRNINAVALADWDILVSPPGPTDAALASIEQDVLQLIVTCGRAMFADLVGLCLWPFGAGVRRYGFADSACISYTPDGNALLENIEYDGENIH